MKFACAIFSILFLWTSIGVGRAAENPSGSLRCVVIDAGHGGKDPGAVANGVQEKAVNLGVALKLGKKIEQGLPGVKVVYTRKDDRFLELSRRSQIAKEAGGDLFISIHTNAAKNTAAKGTETFLMGVDSGNKNLDVVMRENAVISLEADYTSRYEGYDPHSAESVIMFSLMQYAYQSQSLNLAGLIQGQYTSHAKRSSRGVKQAGFLVLWRTPMPSVLTEVGFVTNADEAKFMASDKGQEQIATALFNAVKAYKEQLDGNKIATAPGGRIKTEPVVTPAVKEPIAQPAVVTETAEKSRRRKEAPAPVAEEKPVERAAAPQKGTTFVSPTAEGESGGEPPVEFWIQIKSVGSRIAVNSSNFGSYAKEVVEKQIDGRYKYYCQKSDSYKEALILQGKVRESIPDAFIVAFRDGKPVPLSQVIQQ